MEIGQGFSFGLGVMFTFYFFLYIKSSCVLLFVVFLMEKGNKKLLKKREIPVITLPKLNVHKAFI